MPSLVPARLGTFSLPNDTALTPALFLLAEASLAISDPGTIHGNRTHRLLVAGSKTSRILYL